MWTPGLSASFDVTISYSLTTTSVVIFLLISVDLVNLCIYWLIKEELLFVRYKWLKRVWKSVDASITHTILWSCIHNSIVFNQQINLIRSDILNLFWIYDLYLHD